jgi:hypothetical protein
LIARAYATTYPWGHKFIVDHRLPDVGLGMPWPVGRVPAANDPTFQRSIIKAVEAVGLVLQS